jgi:hypothetical protein
MQNPISSEFLTQQDLLESASIIKERHEQFLKDGISFDAKAALTKLKEELGLSKPTPTTPGA